MDANTVLQAISAVGFPIVMCLIMVKLVYNLQEQHTKEVESLRTSIDNNTKVLDNLMDKLDKLVN